MISGLVRRILLFARTTRITGLVVLLALITHQVLTAAPIAVFGREVFFTLNAADTAALKNSGFNTVILFVVDVEANGDLNYNGNHLVVTNGVYMGDPNWGARLAALKQAPTTINRIEVCTGGAGAKSWVNIKNLIAAQGTNSNSILYRNFLALKNALGVDAICNDDEIAYDATSAATFNRLITSLGMKNTLCPYNNAGYWQGVFNNSAIDAIYLQCYDGGAGNNPAAWNGYFGGFKVCPGDWYFNSAAAVDSKFAGWAPVISGGFMWQFEYLGANLNAYATAIKRAVDPLIVTPATGFSGIAAYNQRVLPASTPMVLSNGSATAFSWSVVNTSSWLSVSTTLGTLPGGASTTMTASLNTSTATNLAPGLYSATLVFSNQATGIAVSRRFSLNTSVANWPVSLTGFNAGILAGNSATAGTPTASAFDIPNSYCFYQAGLAGTTRGLPLDGVFTSLVDGATAFQLAAYGSANNALMLGGTYPSSGTLTLTSPAACNSLAILASSANGGGQGTCVVNFSDGSRSPALAFNAQDWFYVLTNVALQGFGRLRLGASLSIDDNGDSNPNLYQTTLNLAALGLTKPISSLTFTKPAGGSTAILAISGMANSIPVSAPVGLQALPGTNATVQLTWTPSAGATNYLVGASTASGSNYLTIGQTTSPGYNVGGLANGTTYYFVVSAVGTLSQSTNSSQVSAMPGSYLGWALSPNPVAYWPLNESSGNVAYEVIRGSNGVYGGGYTFTTSGALGAGFASPHRATFYNGSGYTRIPRLIGATNFSILFWVRTTATAPTGQWYNGSGMVDGEVGGTTGDFGVALVGNKVGFGVGNPDTTLTSAATINNGLWHQVAVTRDAGSGQMILCIDGRLDANMVGPGGIRTNAPALRIGSLQTGANFLNGYLSDVAIYDRVLTTNQIATLFSAASGSFYNVTLTNRLVGTMIRLSWPGNGKLLEATNLTGPWSTNLAVSPLDILPNQPQKFYRIRTH